MKMPTAGATAGIAVGITALAALVTYVATRPKVTEPKYVPYYAHPRPAYRTYHRFQHP